MMLPGSTKYTNPPEKTNLSALSRQMLALYRLERINKQGFKTYKVVLEAVKLLKTLQYDRYSVLGEDAKFCINTILEKLK